MDLGPPSDASAVIVRARLPPALERLRRRSVGSAGAGLPAHVTLLYPFVPPNRLDRSVRRRLAAIACAHAPFAYVLAGRGRWPTAVYGRVDPVAAFAALQADLAAEFPAFPVYGPASAFAFEPHVTVAEGPAIVDPRTEADRAWASLPTSSTASAIEVITRTNGGWRTLWRIPLGARPAPKRRR